MTGTDRPRENRGGGDDGGATSGAVGGRQRDGAKVATAVVKVGPRAAPMGDATPGFDQRPDRRGEPRLDSRLTTGGDGRGDDAPLRIPNPLQQTYDKQAIQQARARRAGN